MKSKKKQKHIAVLFSSGLDSTYLVYKNLKEGHIVQPYYVDIKNNENKRIVELQNAQKLTELFVEEFPNMRYLKTLTEVSVNIDWGCDLLFTQIPVWLFSLSYLSNPNVQEIHIGYVSNDDAISYIDEIQKFYKAQQWLHREKLPKLCFPLLKESKCSMMDELPVKYRTYVTSCENPILKPYFIKSGHRRIQYFEPCGTCVACNRVIRERLGYNFQYKNLISKYYQKLEQAEHFARFKEHHPEQYEGVLRIIEDTYIDAYEQKRMGTIEVDNYAYGGDVKDGYEAVGC